MRKNHLLAILALGLLFYGCSPASVRWHNKRIRSEPASKEEPTGKHRLKFKWMRQGRNIQVFAKKISLCQQMSGEKVTLRPTRTAKARAGNYLIALALGIGAPVVGVGLILAPPLDGNTPKERAEMKTLQEVLGWSFVIGGGVAGLAILIGTAVSAKTTYRKPFIRFDEFEKKTGDCEYPLPAPAASEEVTLSIGGNEVSKAITDSKGVAALSLPNAGQLGQYSKDQVKRTQISMSGTRIQIDLSETATYKAAVKEAARLARLKAEEAARKAREEKERRRKAIAEAKAKRAELLKKLRAKMLKRPRVMYAKGIDPSCEMPNMPCSGAYLVEGKEYKVVARTPNHWGIAECDDQAPCMLADVRLWTLKRHLETTQQRKRRQLKTRRTLALKQNLRTCRQLRSIGWRGSCRLVRSLVKAGYTLSRSLNVARRIHSKLLMAARQPGKEKGVISCLSSGNLTQTILRVERGATESNVDSLASCHRKRGGARLFAKAFRITQGDARAILQIYKGK